MANQIREEARLIRAAAAELGCDPTWQQAVLHFDTFKEELQRRELGWGDVPPEADMRFFYPGRLGSVLLHWFRKDSGFRLAENALSNPELFGQLQGAHNEVMAHMGQTALGEIAFEPVPTELLPTTP